MLPGPVHFPARASCFARVCYWRLEKRFNREIPIQDAEMANGKARGNVGRGNVRNKDILREEMPYGNDGWW